MPVERQVIRFRPPAWYCTLTNISMAAPRGSQALAEYLAQVYGHADAVEASFKWDWNEVDLVWLALLPAPFRKQCHGRWPPAPMHAGSVFVAPDSFAAPASTLWHYRHKTYCHCCGMPNSEAFRDMPCKSEMGGPRRMPLAVNSGWIEVTHMFGGVAAALGAGQPQMFEREAFWMYRATGSGLWYYTGRTLVASDTVDAARMLNLTLSDGYANCWDHGWAESFKGANKPRPTTKPGLLHRLRSLGFETLLLTSHLDPDTNSAKYGARAFYKIEVVGLRQHVRMACPPDAVHIAWGWRARRRPCRCVATSASPFICHNGNNVSFPFRHVQCNTSDVAGELKKPPDACLQRRLLPAEELPITIDVVECESAGGSIEQGSSSSNLSVEHSADDRPVIMNRTCGESQAAKNKVPWLQSAASRTASSELMLDAVECWLLSRPMPWLNAGDFEYRGVRCVDVTIAKMLMQLAWGIAGLKSPSWHICSGPAAVNKWARHLGCKDTDAWRCMVGSVVSPPQRRCLEHGRHDANPPPSTNRTVLALVLLRKFVLQGYRASPLLEQGPVVSLEPSLSSESNGSIDVSVHVRGGDSCDHVDRYPLWNRTDLREGVWQGRPGVRGVRHCVHPSAYLYLLNGLRRTRHVRRVLLATDSVDAVDIFRDVPGLVVRSFKRTEVEHVVPSESGVRRPNFLELRPNLSAEVATSALEDLRLLSQGHLLLGAMCGTFSSLVWNVMVARLGRAVPYISVDSCTPGFDAWPPQPSFNHPDVVHTAADSGESSHSACKGEPSSQRVRAVLPPSMPGRQLADDASLSRGGLRLRLLDPIATTTGLGDRIARYLIVATIAQLLNATVVSAWMGPEEALGSWGYHRYPPHAETWFLWPRGLEVVSMAQWRKLKQLPHLHYTCERKFDPVVPNELCEAAAGLGPGLAGLEQVPETAYRIVTALGEGLTDGGAHRITCSLAKFMATYWEVAAQLRPRHAVKNPPGPFIAVHARRGDKAPDPKCRACDVAEANSQLWAIIDVLKRRHSKSRWLVVSDSEPLRIALRAALAPKLIYATQAGTNETMGMLTGEQALFDFWALSRAELIVQSVTSAVGNAYSGWSSFSFAASRLAGEKCMLLAVAHNASRLHAMATFAGVPLHGVGIADIQSVTTSRHVQPSRLACNLSCHGALLRVHGAEADMACDSTIPQTLRQRSHVHYWRSTSSRQMPPQQAALCVKTASWHVLTFGSHGSYAAQARGLCARVRASQPQVDGCTALDIASLPHNERSQLGIDVNVQGIGWWKWKPLVISRALGSHDLQAGDILLYLDRDAPVGNASLTSLFCLGQNSGAQHGVAAFHAPCFTDRAWTKRALVVAMRATAEQLDTSSLWAGLLVFRKQPAAFRLVGEWLQWARRGAFDGIQLEPGETNDYRCTSWRARWIRQGGNTTLTEDPVFCDHRHDQSVLSMLVKQQGIKTYPVPVQGHDVRDVWLWEAGFCEAEWPLMREWSPSWGLSWGGQNAYGSLNQAAAQCRNMQGWAGGMADYSRTAHVFPSPIG